MSRLICLLVALLLGCPGKTAQRSKTEPPAKTGGGVVGVQGSSLDPVCGMKVDATAPARVELDGNTYFFCDPKCAEKFKASPEKYLASKAKTAKTGG